VVTATRAIMRLSRLDGSDNDGMADDLALVFSEP
jgi:hypothetical protein